MPFKFEKLEIWQRALGYVERTAELAQQLPRSEEYNLKSQINRAATLVALNIAEGSTGQTDAEQARFVGLAIRSLLETVACLHIISRRNLLDDKEPARALYRDAETLAAMMHSFRKSLVPEQTWLREDIVDYIPETDRE